jgi:opacity protein-like surface antigen
MRIPTTAIVLATGLLLGSTPAAAQRAPEDRLGVRGLATFGVSQMAAKDGFEAVFGSSTLRDFGAGAQVTNLWRGLFAEVTFSRSEDEGERVFVHAGTVYQLGIPLTLKLTTIDATAGYRFSRGRRFLPYLAAGYTTAGYEERSSFAGPGDDVEERFGGLVALGGVEVRTLNWLHVRAEGRYRHIPDALGGGGVSEVYGDDSLGGLRFGVLVAVGR